MSDTTQNGSARTLGASNVTTPPARRESKDSASSVTSPQVTGHASKNSGAIASVLRKTGQDEASRAQFTPSTYPGVTNLGLASQKAGYDSVAARNPDIQPAPQDRLQVQSRNVSDIQYRRFAQYIEEQSGIVLGENKHYLVNSRLSSLLMRFKVSTIDELINRAMQPTVFKDISSAVIDAMTTNETLWFRDTYPYLALRNMILPELARSGKQPIRIWSAACSSGQEPYSIAMIVQEQVSTMVHIDPAQCQIIGTDISPEMLEQCRFAHYDNHALARGLSAERKARFFKPTSDPNVMRIDDKIKQMVAFKQMNLLGSYSLLGRFDIIFCRNVLIYFSNDVKKQILNKFALCLNPGGYLILGSSESIQGLSDKYDMVRCNPGLAYRLKGPESLRASTSGTMTSASKSTLSSTAARRPSTLSTSARPSTLSSTSSTLRSSTLSAAAKPVGSPSPAPSPSRFSSASLNTTAAAAATPASAPKPALLSSPKPITSPSATKPITATPPVSSLSSTSTASRQLTSSSPAASSASSPRTATGSSTTGQSDDLSSPTGSSVRKLNPTRSVSSTVASTSLRPSASSYGSPRRSSSLDPVTNSTGVRRSLAPASPTVAPPAPIRRTLS